MAKSIYGDFASLLGDLQYDLIDVAYEVAEEIKDIEVEVINEVVYNQYDPRHYERRMENGGLTDKRNMKEDVNLISDGLDITVINETRGNSDYKNAQGYTSGYIADIIEEGKGYGYDLDSYIGARPFQETTQKVIDYTDRVDKVIENKLIKKRWIE